MAGRPLVVGAAGRNTTASWASSPRSTTRQVKETKMKDKQSQTLTCGNQMLPRRRTHITRRAGSRLMVRAPTLRQAVNALAINGIILGIAQASQ